MADAVFVVNLGEINRSFAKLGPEISKAAKIGLREGVEPMKAEADQLALSRLSGMRRARKTQRRVKGFVGPLRPAWSIQKIGQTIHEVYIVPTQKGQKGSLGSPLRRPKFATVMLEKSYDPAFEHGRAGVVAHVDNWLGRAINTF